jgi:hypothetical protein
MTEWTTTSVQPIEFDIKFHTLDQRLATVVAQSVFVERGKIAAVDVVKPGIFTDLPGVQ